MRVQIPAPVIRMGEDPNSPDERELLQRLIAHVGTLTDVVRHDMAAQRRRIRSVANESLVDPSGSKLTVIPCSQNLVRVQYVLGYCVNTSTLKLGGTEANPRFTAVYPAGPFALVLGDGEGGGLILNGNEPRILVNGGAAGLMSLLLAGEILPDQLEL